MISNCDKFKALVPIVNETSFTVEGRWNDPNFYLFTYDKADKEITIHFIQIFKNMIQKVSYRFMLLGHQKSIKQKSPP